MREVRCPVCHRRHELEVTGIDRGYSFSCPCGLILTGTVSPQAYRDRHESRNPAVPTHALDERQLREIGRSLDKYRG